MPRNLENPFDVRDLTPVRLVTLLKAFDLALERDDVSPPEADEPPILMPAHCFVASSTYK